MRGLICNVDGSALSIDSDAASGNKLSEIRRSIAGKQAAASSESAHRPRGGRNRANESTVSHNKAA